MTEAATGRGNWYKGHTHCHSTTSDGNLSPEGVAAWYRDHGYSFLSITDHHKLTDPAKITGIESDTFILLPGTEVSAVPLGKEVHVCGINISRELASRGGSTPTETLQMLSDDIRGVGGLVQVNHPNWHWGLTAEDIRPVSGALLLEVYNMGSDCMNQGDFASGRPSTEEMWDDLLTGGKTIWGVCSDDTHNYTDGARDGPGYGWIVARAHALTREHIVEAMERGDFYASTGVELEDVRRSRKQVSLKIKPAAGIACTTQFIGSGGKILAESSDLEPSYTCRGDEGYVRARVQASDGSLALLQPVWTSREAG